MKTRSGKILLVLMMLSFCCTGIYAQCWVLKWQDDFNGNSLDSERWTPEIGTAYNNELQYYTDRAENIQVNNGSLKLIARKESFNGQSYTSGRINTRHKVDFTYGRVESRMKLVNGQGLWPAFWMLASSGNWPKDGEIDIMELLGHEPGKTYGTCHYTVNNAHASKGDFTVLPNGGSFADDFHVLAVEWTPDSIVWLVDNAPFFTATKSEIGSLNWPYKQDYFVILNLAVGGNWPGNPNASTVFPATMEVDWVKVYQHNPDIRIDGVILTEPNTNAVYSLPDWGAGASYNWTVSGGNIISGQNTPSIDVQWNSASDHYVNCSFTNDCGNFTTYKSVKVSPNRWLNPGFEEAEKYWVFNVTNGASASFESVINNEAPEGNRIARVQVNTPGPEPWNVQLHRVEVDVVKDSVYTLGLCAKAVAGGQQTQINFLHPTNYTNYAWRNIPLTTNWTKYQLDFTAPYTGKLLFTQDIGFSTGVFFSDRYYFGLKSLIPTGGDCDASTVSVREGEEQQIRIFPNPATQVVSIDLARWQGRGVQVSFFNTLGEKVLEKNTKSSGVTETFDLSSLKNGTYILKIESRGEAAAFAKLVIAK